MAWVWADRVLDTSITAGTVSLVVSGTSPLGWRTFSTVCAVADTFYYTIHDPITGAWETGEGTYSATNTVARTAVRASSNAGALVNFAANAKNVFIDVIGYYFSNLETNLTIAAGAVAYGDTTGATGITGDLTNFAWDVTNKRLGIGTSAPAVTLDVRGAGTFTGALIASALTTNAGSVIVDRAGDAASATMYMRADAGMYCITYYQTGTENRWYLGKTSGAESGANAGSDFGLTAYDDAGVSLGTAFTVARASRIVALTVSPTAPTPTAGDSTTKLATTAFVQAAIGVSTPPGVIDDYAGLTAPTGWLFCDGALVSRTTYATLFAAITALSPAITVTIASPAVFTWASNPLANGDLVSLETTGALPTGFAVGVNYYVVARATGTFQLSATSGGAAINSSGTQSGVHTARRNPWGGGNGTTTFGLPDLMGRSTAGKETTATRLTTAGAGFSGATLGAAGGTQTHVMSVAEMPSHGHLMYFGANLAPGVNVRAASGDGTALGWAETDYNGSGGAHQNTQPTIIVNKIIKT